MESDRCGARFDLDGTRVEFNTPFGGQVLVVWATSGTSGVGCSGTYWKAL